MAVGKTATDPTAADVTTAGKDKSPKKNPTTAASAKKPSPAKESGVTSATKKKTPTEEHDPEEDKDKNAAPNSDEEDEDYDPTKDAGGDGERQGNPKDTEDALDSDSDSESEVVVADQKQDESAIVETDDDEQQGAVSSEIELKDDGVPVFKADRKVVHDKAHWMGIHIPKHEGGTTGVFALTNGCHFRCNEPECDYIMNFMARLTAHCHNATTTETNLRTVKGIFFEEYKEECKRLTKVHDGYSIGKVPDRQQDAILSVFKGFVTDKNVGPNGMIDYFVCQFAKTRLGHEGYRVDGDIMDQAIHAASMVIVWLSKQTQAVEMTKIWPLPLVYLMIDHMMKYRGMTKVDLTYRAETTEAAKARHKEQSQRCRNQSKTAKWYVEKREDVKAELQDFVKHFEADEEQLYPNCPGEAPLSNYFKPKSIVAKTPGSSAKKKKRFHTWNFKTGPESKKPKTG